MATNVSRGAAAKSRTKRWLEQRGYAVGDMEITRWVYRNGRPAFAVKKDQFASDLIALGHNAVVFVQVKSGEAARTGTFPDARRKFGEHPFPEGVRTIIIGWPPMARVPRIVETFTEGGYRELQAV